MELDEASGAGHPTGLFSLAAKVAEREVEPFDIGKPAFLVGPAAAGDEVRFELVEAADHSRADVEHRAADAGMLVHARRSVRACAAAEFHLALVEVLLELVPFGVGRGPVLLAWSQAPATVEEGLVVADEILPEDRDVAAGGLQVEVSEQSGADVDGQPVVDEVGGEDAPEVVGCEARLRERRVPLGEAGAAPCEHLGNGGVPEHRADARHQSLEEVGIGRLCSFSAAS